MRHLQLMEAVVLSYLQGCAPVGKWASPLTAHMAEDLDMSKVHVCLVIAGLKKKGFIAIRRNSRLRCREYRVLIRLETPGVEIRANANGRHSEEARARMSAEALKRSRKEEREAQKAAKRKRLFRFAGYEGRV